MDDIFEAATRQAMLVRAGASAHGTGLAGGVGTNGRSTFSGDGLKSERRKSGMMLGVSGNNGTYSGAEEKNGSGNMNTSKGCCLVA